jgi:hypothetical protein
MPHSRRALLVVAVAVLPACGLFRGDGQGPRAPEAPAATPLPPLAQAVEPVLVRAWAEPRQLPPAGGQTQIIVLARKRNGDPFEGVEVRFTTTAGSLYSQSKVLLTDANGRTRDRLTTRDPAVVTVNVGGSVQTIPVAVAGR